MKIQTLTVVVGTQACNAKCPFCVSQMTGFGELPKTKGINYRNLNKAILRAQLGGVNTVLLTGKGEPTLYPDQITAFLKHLDGKFPAVELQTNGLDFGMLVDPEHSSRTPLLTDEVLREWWELGLDTIALSVVSIHREHNAEVYHPNYPDLEKIVAHLHTLGFSVRLCVMMQKGYVDSAETVKEVIDWCRDREVEQLTIRPIRKPEMAKNGRIAEYVNERGLDPVEIRDLYDALRYGSMGHATMVLQLMHGAEIYDVDGQNVCVSDCLTLSTDPEELRQLIFYADGRITYDWQHRGAILLGGRGPE